MDDLQMNIEAVCKFLAALAMTVILAGVALSDHKEIRELKTRIQAIEQKLP